MQIADGTHSKDHRRGVSLKIKTGIQQGQGYIRNAAIIITWTPSNKFF